MDNTQNKSADDLISDVYSKLIDVEASMKLVVIAADAPNVDPSSIGSFIDLMRPIIMYAADQLDDIRYILRKGTEKDE